MNPLGVESAQRVQFLEGSPTARGEPSRFLPCEVFGHALRFHAHSMQRYQLSSGLYYAFRITLIQQFLRNISTVLGNLLQHGFMEPHVHLCRITHFICGAAKLDREFFTRFKAAIEVQEFQ